MTLPPTVAAMPDERVGSELVEGVEVRRGRRPTLGVREASRGGEDEGEYGGDAVHR